MTEYVQRYDYAIAWMLDLRHCLLFGFRHDSKYIMVIFRDPHVLKFAFNLPKLATVEVKVYLWFVHTIQIKSQCNDTMVTIEIKNFTQHK